MTVEGANISQIWTKQLPRGPFTRLSLEGSINNRPRWTPDGRAVTFLSNRSDLGVFASKVYLRRADGSAMAERLVDAERPLGDALVSGDGAWLVARTTSPNQDIVAYPLKSDGVPIPLVTTYAQESAPALSPLVGIYVERVWSGRSVCGPVPQHGWRAVGGIDGRRAFSCLGAEWPAALLSQCG